MRPVNMRPIKWINTSRGTVSYSVIDEGAFEYRLSGHKVPFNIKKTRCFDTKEEAEYDKFKRLCFDKLNGMTGVNDTYKDKSFGIWTLKNYLQNTKKQEFGKRFVQENAEYFI